MIVRSRLERASNFCGDKSLLEVINDRPFNIFLVYASMKVRYEYNT